MGWGDTIMHPLLCSRALARLLLPGATQERAAAVGGGGAYPSLPRSEGVSGCRDMLPPPAPQEGAATGSGGNLSTPQHTQQRRGTAWAC